jgi:hypothetical protein
MSQFWKPGRELRRRQSGQPCPGCGLSLHHRDVVAYSGGTQTYFLHAACADLLAENAAAAASEEDDAAAAHPGAEAQRGDSPIVPDRVDWHAETQEPRS